MKTVEKYGIIIAALSGYVTRLNLLISLAKEAEEWDLVTYFTIQKTDTSKLLKEYKNQITKAEFQGTRLYVYNWTSRITKRKENHVKKRIKNEGSGRWGHPDIIG